MLNDDVIVCVGSGSVNAATLAEEYAATVGKPFNGLLDYGTSTLTPGVYHTSVVDIDYSTLVSKRPGTIKFLSEDKSNYNTEYDYNTTVDLVSLLSQTTKVIGNLSNIREQLISEKYFCIMPYVGFRSDASTGHNRSCCFMREAVSTTNGQFHSAAFNTLRSNMQEGIRISNCEDCYLLEESNVVSHRQTLTVEWARKLNFNNLSEIVTNKNIAVHQVLLSNECNALCRICNPASSNLIDKEYIKIGLHNPVDVISSITRFDDIDTSSLRQLYVAGGEPTINKEFLSFMKKCISDGVTDFELVINTNAFLVSDTFAQLAEHFQNITFEVSIDGNSETNYYIRWPITWEKFTANIRSLYSLSKGRVSFNTVVSIYNVFNLSTICEFIDANYPNSMHHMTYLDTPTQLRPGIFPDKELIKSDLAVIKSNSRYNSDLVFKSLIDGIEYIEDSSKQLGMFFEFNDKLDKSRGVKIEDYIPELGRHRGYV